MGMFGMGQSIPRTEDHLWITACLALTIFVLLL